MTNLERVKQDGYVLQFVENQTPEICLSAVRQDGWALKDVNPEYKEICQRYLDGAAVIL